MGYLGGVVGDTRVVRRSLRDVSWSELRVDEALELSLLARMDLPQFPAAPPELEQAVDELGGRAGGYV